jgi:hypothetical protein
MLRCCLLDKFCILLADPQDPNTYSEAAVLKDMPEFGQLLFKTAFVSNTLAPLQPVKAK